MKVFISYSVDDRELVHRLAAEIRPHAEPLFWDQNNEPGTDAWGTIFRWIESADCVIAIITDKVVARGESVHQEVGYAKGRGKFVIPVVASDVEASRLGCLKGITYIRWQRGNETEALQTIKNCVATLNEDKQRVGLVMIGLLFVVLVALGRKQ